MNSNTGGEGEIRKNMIEAGLVDCMVALPAQLFYNTMIPACLWFLAKGRSMGDHKGSPQRSPQHSPQHSPLRNRSNEILFIDARKLGTMINRRNKMLTDGTDENENDIKQITDTYHKWRNAVGESVGASLVASLVGAQYEDIPGFCKVATLDEVRQNNYVLMPGRYVGTEEEEIDLIPFDEKMKTLTDKLTEQFAQGEKLQKTIRENLKGIGYEF